MNTSNNMPNDIRIDVEDFGSVKEVRGFVGTNLVMSMTNRIGLEWIVDSSSCLPNDPERAAIQLECMGQVMAAARLHGAP